MSSPFCVAHLWILRCSVLVRAAVSRVIFGTSWDAERKKRAVLPGLKGAIALSQAVIAGGAVAGVAVTLHQKHPHDPSKPLMDFDIALMLLPSQLLG